MKVSFERAVDDLLTDINTTVKQHTPVAPKNGGYAKRQWKYTRPYRFGYEGPVIENRAPYIAILDGGRRYEGGKMVGSTQAPDGIVDPVVSDLVKRNRKI